MFAQKCDYHVINIVNSRDLQLPRPHNYVPQYQSAQPHICLSRDPKHTPCVLLATRCPVRDITQEKLKISQQFCSINTFQLYSHILVRFK